MMERIKRRMVTVNSLEVMRRTFKVGLVVSEETESDLEYDLGMLHHFPRLVRHCVLIYFYSAQTTRKVVSPELLDPHAHFNASRLCIVDVVHQTSAEEIGRGVTRVVLEPN